MGFAIYQDMKEINTNIDKWINHGRRVLENSCKHKDGIENQGYCSKCDISEDSAIPMMNFLYPLELDNFDEEDILRVVKETNCSVFENEDTGKWFLVLCGGGMDLSQDIAYAYFILERQIPFDLLTQVISQKDFSIGHKQYLELKKAVIEQAKNKKIWLDNTIQKWEEEK